MKKRNFILIAIIGLIIGFLLGIFVFGNNKEKSSKVEIGLQEIEDDCTKIASMQEEGELEIATNSKVEKISPNCKLTFKSYYSKCGHLIENQENIKETYVNMSKQEFQNVFNAWEIENFTSDEIILYKELNQNCDEHFLLSEKDGYIAIYKLDETNNKKLIKTTDIALEYLETKDLEQIKSGIIVYSKKDLNKTLEDFE